MSELQTPVIFLAFASEKGGGQGELDTPQELEQVQSAFRAAEDNGDCEVALLPYAETAKIFDQLGRELYRDRVAVFHYGGHADSEGIYLGDGAASTKAYSTGLAGLLGSLSGLQLVFLNGCSTRGQVEGLLASGVPAVIATDVPIKDSTAIAFATRFYKSLAAGQSLQEAFDVAEWEIKTQLKSPEEAYRGGRPRGGAPAVWPWKLYPQDAETEDVERAHAWSLPYAHDPLYILPPLERGGGLPNKPYKHLHWFEEDDAEIFFGRNRDIAALYHAVTSQDGDPIILFCGESLAGKSSILEAGLKPRLKKSHDVRLERRDGRSGLPNALQNALRCDSPDELLDAWIASETEERKTLVILDQVDEAWTRPLTNEESGNDEEPDRELVELVDALHAIFAEPEKRPEGRLVLSFRKDYLDEVEKLLEARPREGRAELRFVKVSIEHLDREGVVEAVRGPASTPPLRTKYGFEEEIPGELARDIASDLVGDAGAAVAQTLQILLTEMWRERGPEGAFDRALYDRVNEDGIHLDDVLGKRLEELQEVCRESVESGLALDLLAFHTTDLGTSRTRAGTTVIDRYRDRKEEVRHLIQESERLGLLIRAAGGGQHDAGPEDQESGDRDLGDLRLAHDSFAAHVKKRFDESRRPGQRAFRVMKNRIKDYRTPSERSKQGGQENSERVYDRVAERLFRSHLLGAADLRIVEDGRAGMPAFGSRETGLYDESLNRRTWLRRIGAIVGLVLTATPVYFFYDLSKDAERKRQADAVNTALVGMFETVDLSLAGGSTATPTKLLQRQAEYAESKLDPLLSVRSRGLAMIANLLRQRNVEAGVVEGYVDTADGWAQGDEDLAFVHFARGGLYLQDKARECEARDLFKKALEKYRSVSPEHPSIIETQGGLGTAHLQLAASATLCEGDRLQLENEGEDLPFEMVEKFHLSEAKGHINAALTIARPTGDKALLWLLNTLASTQTALARKDLEGWGEVEETLKEAAKLLDAGGSARDKASFLQSRGEARFARAQGEKWEPDQTKYFNEAIAAFKEAQGQLEKLLGPDDLEIAEAELVLSKVYREMGNFETADDHLEDALRIQEDQQRRCPDPLLDETYDLLMKVGGELVGTELTEKEWLAREKQAKACEPG